MKDQTIKGKDAFWDLICFYLANDASYIKILGDSPPILTKRINQDHCPDGYRGIMIFVKESELIKYRKEEK